MEPSIYILYLIIVVAIPAILYLLLAMLAAKHGYDLEAGKISFRKSRIDNLTKNNFVEDKLD